MRVNVKKFVFVGAQSQKRRFFRSTQALGTVEFIDPHQRPFSRKSPEVERIAKALKILRAYPTCKQKEFDPHFDDADLAHDIISNQHAIEHCRESLRLLKHEMAQMSVLGDFSMQELKELQEKSGYTLQVFIAKKVRSKEAKKQENLIYLTSAYGLDYFLSFSKTKVHFKGLVELELRCSLGDLQKKQSSILKRLENLESKQRDFCAYYTLLYGSLVEYLNAHHLSNSQNFVEPIIEGVAFSVCGWIAENHVEATLKQVKQLGVSVHEVRQEVRDRVPTHLENKGMDRVGEDLVHIYDCPSIRDRDPSSWVLWSFALFFAVIIGDGGYGLIFLSLALYLQYRFYSYTDVTKRMVKLFSILAVSCVSWGLLTSSFFGINFDVNHPVRKISLLHYAVKKKVAYHFKHQDATYREWVKAFPRLRGLKDPQKILENAFKQKEWGKEYPLLDSFSDSILIELAVLIGLIHLSLSCLRVIDHNLSGLGWIVAMWGAYLYFPVSPFLKASSLQHFLFFVSPAFALQWGLHILFSGIFLAVFLAILQNRLWGLGEIVNTIQVFSDVLSYLRLYALGLSGSMISSTFNAMAENIGYFKGGILVLLLGHFLNIILSVMSGVIHGLRLNFLEWYHYSFEGGGKLLRPLKLLKIR